MSEIYEYGTRALKWSKCLGDYAEIIGFNTKRNDQNTISLVRLDDEREFV